MINYSELESSRFLLNVHRGIIEKINLIEIEDYFVKNNPDIAILRINVEQIKNIFELGQIKGYRLIFADALVCYTANLSSIEGKIELKNNLNFELVTNSNKFIIGEIVPEIFADYTSHYTANPLLDESKITEGYIEWAQDYVNDINKDRISWIVKKNNIVIGFATCSFYTETGVCEGVLYGVKPTFSGGGVYTDIIKFTKNYFKQLGFHRMKVSTQLQNYAVQKVWTREGFLLENAFYTFHLNKLSLYDNSI